MKTVVFTLSLMLSTHLCATENEDAFSLFEARVVRLALEQANKISGYWDPAQRDCSGLVRFLYRRTLGKKFIGWLQGDNKRHEYASAEDLVHYNFEFVNNSAEESTLKTGDILVFYSENKQPKDRFHLMVALKSPHKNNNDVILVYHNGASGKQGAVRKVSLKSLKLELNNEWSPTRINPRFRGVYRWQGWKEKT